MDRLFRLIIVPMATAASLGAQGDTTQPIAVERRLTSNLELHQVSVLGASVTVLKALARPGGIVSLSAGDCFSKEQKSIFVPWGLDLRGALDIIVEGSSSSWTMNDGVVNVFLRTNLPDVMALRIESYQWNTRDLARPVISRLFALDHVRTFLAQRGIVGGVQSLVIPEKASRLINGVPEKPIGKDYSLKDTTLLDALNRIVASYGDAVWLYEESLCGGRREYRVSAR
ncbi:MAG: hypothetical protein JNL98_25815 [Bryobacterales bacterium]|nr:hypothetical protein [Bryobacterales bacterium]